MNIQRYFLPLIQAALLLALTSFSAAADALERRYLAALESSAWTLTESNIVSCRLEHDIPRFGRVVFSQESGRPLQLELQSMQKFAKGINVELRSETTGWNKAEVRAVLARFETRGGSRLFRIPDEVAEQTFYELRAGHQPGFLFYTDYPLIASLSVVGFSVAAQSFAECVAQLYRDNFRDVRISNIFFEPDAEFASLDEEGRAFDRMLDYLDIDDGIREIVVTGHADKTGLACYNEGLSERRAQYVSDLLIAMGVDPEKMRIDYAGERSPASKGSSKRAHANNRRVSVELRR